MRLARALAVAVALSALGAAAAAVGWRAWVAAEAYPLERLQPRDVASLVVTDRAGQRLWQAGGKARPAGRWTPLAEIAPVAVAATLAAEDHRFYGHSGVDPLGVARAAWLNLRALRPAYGASTLTMQLVRLLDPALRSRSLFGKLQQAGLAQRLERALSKREILEQYLNRAYYGNGAFGIADAAREYFGASAARLSPGQAAFLAALPRAPTGYDPYRRRGRALARMRHVLSRMQRQGWLPAADVRLARDAPPALRGERSGARARHFLDYVLTALPGRPLGGARLRTTLDLDLQRRLEVAVRRHLDTVGSRGVTQAGLIAIDNRSGDILAMVGSRRYEDAAARGAVNATVLPRRAGSTLKPFVYALALERGDSAATLALDVVLPGEAKEPYTADVRQHGLARYREALAGSYNLAAVHTLQKVGVESLVERLRRAGVTTLEGEPGTYGDDLAIGNAEIRLIDYVGAFAAFGNAGRAVRPRALLGVQRRQGGRVAPLEGAAAGPGAGGAPRLDASGAAGPAAARAAPVVQPARSVAVLSPAVAYQVFDILSDPDARRPMFGRSAPLEVGFPVALKTGTTRGYTDNLAFGTTREFSVAAWAGNFDGTPTRGVMAMQGAAPLVRAAFVALAALYGTPTAPERPGALVARSVCPLSGKRPHSACPGRKHEWMSAAAAQGLDEAAACEFHLPSGRGGPRVAFPPELAPWARAHGLRDASPSRRAGQPPLRIAYPGPGSVFQLDPARPAKWQVPPVQVQPAGLTRVRVDGLPLGAFVPTVGRHRVSAERGSERAEVEIVYE